MDDLDDSDDEEDPPSWLIENERQRLWRGPSAEEPESALFRMDRIKVACAGDADAVLARVRETLDVVPAQSPDNWPSDEVWLKWLPFWFVAQCRTERETVRESSSDFDFRWTASGFAYWFLPDERQWWWWNAEIQDANRLIVETAPFDLPYIWENLEWLLYAAGALYSEHYKFGPEPPDRRTTQ
jgi:hypothetical protein